MLLEFIEGKLISKKGWHISKAPPSCLVAKLELEPISNSGASAFSPCLYHK